MAPDWVAESGGSIRIGQHCIILENAVVRATGRHSCTIGNHCVIGPNSHVVGAEIDNEVFIATGAAVFHGAVIGHGSEVRINGTVHLRSRLAPGSMVPIGWVAVGSPTQILPADQDEAIRALQTPLDFPGFVYGCRQEHAERDARDHRTSVLNSLDFIRRNANACPSRRCVVIATRSARNTASATSWLTNSTVAPTRSRAEVMRTSPAF